jgi:hypothetical protein
MYKKVEVDIGGNSITFETGKLAKQTDGSVVVTSGDSMVLVTAVAEKKSKNMGFLPLTIEYQERMYAAGRIPGNTLVNHWFLDHVCQLRWVVLAADGTGAEGQTVAETNNGFSF